MGTLRLAHESSKRSLCVPLPEIFRIVASVNHVTETFLERSEPDRRDPQRSVTVNPDMRTRTALSRPAFLRLSGLPVFLLLGLALTIGTLMAMTAPAQAQTKKFYIAPDDHTDYFWTADDTAYQQAFLDTLDYYLNLADSTAGNPSDFQSRWNCDGWLWLYAYEKNKTPAQFDRLMNRVKDGHISAPLTAFVSCYGGTPTEAVLRGMYYPGTLERRYNYRFPLAVAMENQTLPYGLGSLWAGAGAKYSWKGVCGCDTGVSASGDRQYDIYWWTGPDGSKILMKWNSLELTLPSASDPNQGIGGYAEARYPVECVNFLDTNANFQTRYPYNIIGIFGQGWDDFQTQNTLALDAAQSLTNANRRVIVSNETDFFQDFEATYGAGLPSVSASFGNEWELYTASLAEQNARVRRATEKLRAAEALSTIVSLKYAPFAANLTAARDLAWVDLGLFWEHNFGMVYPQTGSAGVTKRIAWQKRLADEIENYVNTLHRDAAAALGYLIQSSGSNVRFYAFNPLSWARTDAADYPWTNASPVKVIDLTTGTETPSQIVTVNNVRYIRILAQNVPAVGYKVFEIQSGAGQTFPAAATVSGGVMDSSRYKVTVASRGAITSLLDKARSNREFAASNGGRYLNDLGAGTGALVVENSGPVSVTLRATASAPVAHTSRITLYAGAGRIAIQNDITQNFASNQTYRFRFNLTAPDVRHEELGAILRAKTNANGGDYSDRTNNIRVDWLSLNHFADMTGSGNVGVTLSNLDCSFFQLGNSATNNLDTATPQMDVLAGGKVVSGSNGLPNQGGDTQFRQQFALQTHDAYDGTAAMKFALEHQNPLATGTIVSGGTAYPAQNYSLLTLSDPNTLLWSLKPAEEGIAQGVIARLWNVSTAANGTLTFAPGPLSGAKETTHIETDLTNAAYSGNVLTTAVAGRQIKTYRLLPGSTPSPPTTITLPAVADAYVRDGVNYANVNYGTSASLIVKKDATSFNRIAYFKFDITTAPATITNAKLRVYGNHTATGGGTSTEFAYPVTVTSWAENALTWNNRPTLGTALGPGVPLNKTLQYYEWDVTSYLQSQKSGGATLVSLALWMTVTPSDGQLDTLNSKESAATPPQLVITGQ